ncbi:site-specific integrase [Corynebacterium sanguinis]
MPPRRRRRDFGKITQKGKRFYTEYSGPDTKRHTPGRSFPTRTDAAGWLAAERRLIDLGTWAPPATRAARQEQANITVREWLATFQEQVETRADRIKPSTAANYARVVRVRITDPIEPGDTDPDLTGLADLPLNQVTKADIYTWWDAVGRNYPDGRTVSQQAYKRLRAAFAEATRRDMVATNPVDIPEAGKKIDTAEKYLPTDREIAAIIDNTPDNYRALTSLVLHHGLRLGEAIALEAHHVTVEPTPAPYMPKVTITVTQNAQRMEATDTTPSCMLIQPTKTKAGERKLPVMARDVPIFLAHIAKHTPTKPTDVHVYNGPTAPRHKRGKITHEQRRLFTATTKGQIVRDTSYRSILDRAKTRANVHPGIDPHTGRNWLITRLAEQGAHLKEIGTLLGQNDLDTIMGVYLKARPQRTVDLMAQVSATLET